MTTSFLKDTFTQAAADVRRGVTLAMTREGAGQLINWWGHAMIAGSVVQGVQYATERNPSSLLWAGVGLVGAIAGYYARGRATRPTAP